MDVLTAGSVENLFISNTDQSDQMQTLANQALSDGISKYQDGDTKPRPRHSIGPSASPFTGTTLTKQSNMHLRLIRPWEIRKAPSMYTRKR